VIQNLVNFDFSGDLTLLLILSQIEFKYGNSQGCNDLCDRILKQDVANIKALNMKGDICKFFCQIDQAFFWYTKAIDLNQNVQS